MTRPLLNWSLMNRISRNCSRKSISLPLFGEVLVLSVVVLPLCASFAIFWAANQHASYAWIGQDVLVRYSIFHFFPLLISYHDIYDKSLFFLPS